MHISEIQAYVAAQITAKAELAALGTPLVFTHFTSDEDARQQIDDAINATGVCIEVGVVEASGDGEKPQNRYSLLDAKFEVFVAESISQAHTPQELALVSMVSTAIQARSSASAPAIRCTGYAAAKSENGYVLNVLSFTLPALL